MFHSEVTHWSGRFRKVKENDNDKKLKLQIYRCSGIWVGMVGLLSGATAKRSLYRCETSQLSVAGSSSSQGGRRDSLSLGTVM